MKIRLILAGFLLVIVFAGAFAAFHAGVGRSPASPVIADLGGDFELSRAGGARVRLQDYRGRVVLLFFGYTHCPDVCPTALHTLKLAMEELSEAIEQVQVIMVTVDPERDSPEHLEQYVRYFHPRFVGLSGTTQQIDRVAQQYRVHHQRGYSAPGGYSVSHSGYIYLLDKRGRVRALLGAGAKQAEIADGVRQLL
jgi:protein SCO1